MVTSYRSESIDEAKNEEITSFWDKHSRSQGIASRLNIKVNRSVPDAVESIYPGIRNLKVLDVGTGAGYSAISLAMLGHDVTGIDLSPKMLEEARWNADRFGCSVKWVLDDIQRSKLNDSQFNLVIFKNSLFTMCNCRRAVAESVRLLKPGGHVLIMDGNYFLDQKIEAYKRRKDYFRAKYGKNDFQTRIDLGNIDYEEVRNLTGELYVNKVRRPGWEVWFLLDLGMTNIHICADDKERYFHMTEFGKMGTPLTYSISAQKPYTSEIKDPVVGDADLIKMRDESYATRDAHVLALGALANKDRYVMVKLLLVSPLSIRQMCDLSGLPQNLVSYNVRLLKESGVVKVVREGRKSVCSIVNPSAMRNLLSILDLLESKSDEDDSDSNRA